MENEQILDSDRNKCRITGGRWENWKEDGKSERGGTVTTEPFAETPDSSRIEQW